jgi:hypothetical protein
MEATLELRCGTDEEGLRDPSWAEVEEAIRRLDGAEYNDLYLDRPSQRGSLAIGGGAGRYFVMLTLDARTEDESWLVATREAAADTTESLVVGGQPGLYPARQVVELNAALAAATDFRLTGDPSESLRWEST